MKITLDPDDMNAAMACPICAGEHVHLSGVTSEPRPGLDGELQAVTISGWCEDSACTFDIRLDQHKGAIFTTIDGSPHSRIDP